MLYPYSATELIMTSASSVENVQKPARCRLTRWKNQTARNASAAADAAKPVRWMRYNVVSEENPRKLQKTAMPSDVRRADAQQRYLTQDFTL